MSTIPKTVKFTEKSQLLNFPEEEEETNKGNFITCFCDLLKKCLFINYDSDNSGQLTFGYSNSSSSSNSSNSSSTDDITPLNQEARTKQKVNFSDYELDVTRYKWKPLLSYKSFSKKYNTPPNGSVPLYD